MKTKRDFLFKMIKALMPWMFSMLIIVSMSLNTIAQNTYSTIADGNWSNVTTWQGGIIPPTSIPAGDEVFIFHDIVYDMGADLINDGTITIECTGPTSTITKLKISNSFNLLNHGSLFITNAVFEQPIFSDQGGAMAGNFTNDGGYLNIWNSYVEIARDWTNINGGTREITDACIYVGGDFASSGSGSIDNLSLLSLVSGMQGSGSISFADGSVSFDEAAFQLAGTSGNFEITSGMASGHIEYVTVQSNYTGNNQYGSGNISVSSGVSMGTGLLLDAYCLGTGSFSPGGMTGSQTIDCSLWSDHSCTQPVFVNGNPKCCTLPLPADFFGYKIEGTSMGTNTHFMTNPAFITCNPGDCTFDPSYSVTITSTDGHFFDWSSNFAIDHMIVKGGPNANVYYYDPPAYSGNGLHPPWNTNGKTFGISHIDWCFLPEPPDCEITGDPVVCHDLLKDYEGPAGDYSYNWSLTCNSQVSPLPEIIGSSTDQIVSVFTGSECGDFSLSLTLTDNGNGHFCSTGSSICERTILVEDQVDPEFVDLPEGGYLGCNPILPSCESVTASDNCGTATVICTPGDITGPECMRSQTFTYVATDICGNSITEDVIYTWTIDNDPPVFANCPVAIIDLDCNPTDLPGCSDAIAAAGEVSDICSGVLTPSCTENPPTVDGCIYTQEFDLQATDECGNTGYCTITYTWVVDNDPPVFANCPLDAIELPCNPTELPDCSDAIAAAGEVSDICSGILTPTCTDNIPTLDGCVYTQTFDLEATDDCDNTGYCTITYTWVVDNDPPIFENCPVAVIDLHCNPTLMPDCSDAIAAAGEVSDICSGILTPSCTANMPTLDGCVYTQTFDLEASDNCGNTGYCTITYTWVVDNNPPEFANCPLPAIELPCNPTDLPDCSDAIAAAGEVSDICSGILTPSCSKNDPVLNGCIYTQEFDLQATDNCGNTGYCTITYTWVVDNDPPEFENCPVTIIDLDCNPTELPDCSDAIAAAGEVSDFCSGILTPDCTANMPTLDGCVYTQTFDLEATDNCGNTEYCTITYTWVVDNDPPEFANCPLPAIELPCNPTELPDCSDAIAAAGEVSDFCSGILIPSCSKNDPVLNGCIYTQEFDLQATDNCGNTGYCTITYTWVIDNDPPVFANCPLPLISLGCNPTDLPDCSDAIAAAGQVTDVCSGTINPECTENDPEISGCIYSQTFDLEATDDCGNTANCTVTYSWIVDNDPPEFTNCPQENIELGCNPTPPECNDVLNLGITANDLCFGPVSPVCNAGQIQISSDGCSYSQDFTLTATDLCMNSATCIVTYTWTVDHDPPEFANCPLPIIDLYCNPAVLPDCSDAIAAAGEVSDICSGALTPSCTQNLPTLDGCVYTQTFDLEATDNCGNTGYCTISYTWVVDNDPPVFENCPVATFDLGCNPTELPGCSDAITAAGEVSDICSGILTPTCTENLPTLDGCVYTQTFDLEATDNCDNTGYCTITYTWVVDNDPPMFTGCPTEAFHLGCNPGSIPGCSDVLALGITAYDVCSGDITPVCESNVMPAVIGCEYTLTYTLTATDNCNNSSSCSVIYTWIEDLVGPEITGVAPEYEFDCNQGSILPWPVITDNCDQQPTWTYTRSDSPPPPEAPLPWGAPYNDEGFYIVVITATDACGNSTSFTIEVTVNPCGQVFCTYTQGFYGNSGGTACDGVSTTEQLIEEALDVSGYIAIGSGGNSLTINSGQAASCVIPILPGGGPSSTLTKAYDCSNIFTQKPSILKKGRLKSSLFSQALTLSINLKLNPGLADLMMYTGELRIAPTSDCDEPNATPAGPYSTHQINQQVIAELQKTTNTYSNTVGGLMDMANDAVAGIGGFNNGLMGKITTALSQINEAFDECRFGYFVVDYTTIPPPYNPTNNMASFLENTMIKVTPNPFRDFATIEFRVPMTIRVELMVYTIEGMHVETLYIGMANEDVVYTHQFHAKGIHRQSVYIYVLKTVYGTKAGKMIMIR